MIVVTGKQIKVDSAGFRFERNAESPGAVTLIPLRADGKSVLLPASEVDMENFIKAYRRACREDVGYRTMENE